MKVLFSFLIIAILSSVGFANISGNAEYELNHSGYAANKHGLGTLLNQTRNLLVAKYSYAVLGGSTTSDIILYSDLSKGASTGVGSSTGRAVLPNNAIITHAWIDVLTTPTTAGSNGTIALRAVTTGDLIAATALTTYTGRMQLVPKGATVSSYLKVVSAGDTPIKMSVAKSSAGQASPLNAGKFNVYIEYVIGE